MALRTAPTVTSNHLLPPSSPCSLYTHAGTSLSSWSVICREASPALSTSDAATSSRPQLLEPRLIRRQFPLESFRTLEAARLTASRSRESFSTANGPSAASRRRLRMSSLAELHCQTRGATRHRPRTASRTSARRKRSQTQHGRIEPPYLVYQLGDSDDSTICINVQLASLDQPRIRPRGNAVAPLLLVQARQPRRDGNNLTTPAFQRPRKHSTRPDSNPNPSQRHSVRLAREPRGSKRAPSPRP